jgi:hypothetical protein
MGLGGPGLRTELAHGWSLLTNLLAGPRAVVVPRNNSLPKGRFGGF